MKFKSLSTATMVAALTIGVFSPLAVTAAPEELDTTGNVEVEQGTAGGGDTETIDPEDPDKTLPTDPDPNGPGENVNPDAGPLIIEKTTDLEFGKIKTSADEVTAFAAPMSYDDGATKRGTYIQWADVRAGGTYGYTITAELSQQFTGDTEAANKLVGATINFSNGKASAQSGNTNVNPSNIATGFELNESDGAVTVVTASKELKEGKGRYIMSFGQSNATPTPNESESVKLTVPAATASNMVIDTYTAKVTWKITAAA